MPERTLYTKRWRVMGGFGLVRFVDDRGVGIADEIAERAVAESLRIERKYSRFRDDSIVSEINRYAGRTPVAVDGETEMLVGRALDLASRTSGAFDPTVGVLRRAWNFNVGRVPVPGEIEPLLDLVDWRRASLHAGTVFLRGTGMELDLGGVAKEYAVDRLAEGLERDGVESAIVNLAGDVRAVRGRGDGKPWKIGVLDPRDRERCRFAVRFPGGGSVATSGDYERYFESDGVRYHHLLDARTGWPARGVQAVTVVAASAFRAGLAATGAFLLGPEAGLAWLEGTAGVEGAMITEGGQLRATRGMGRYSDLPGGLWASVPGI